ncbi:hypothetical protein OUZ56_033934 [Daphnia magna]|uniref:Uncharacterized protein n=1 Tax=Daphnia magna TaxID=35525 RepID=A0ABQ9ZZ21_9CRUS|nr:hypothetical protein OUZ56_033934 [Daphnia magna]
MDRYCLTSPRKTILFLLLYHSGIHNSSSPHLESNTDLQYHIQKDYTYTIDNDANIHRQLKHKLNCFDTDIDVSNVYTSRYIAITTSVGSRAKFCPILRVSPPNGQCRRMVGVAAERLVSPPNGRCRRRTVGAAEIVGVAEWSVSPNGWGNNLSFLNRPYPLANMEAHKKTMLIHKLRRHFWPIGCDTYRPDDAYRLDRADDTYCY